MTILALNRRIKPKPIMPTPALVTTARQAFDDQQKAKRDARAKSPARRTFRYVLMALSAVFLGVALVGGTGASQAQAFEMPWDTGANIAAGVLNFCNPEAVPTPTSAAGFDTSWLQMNSAAVDSTTAKDAVKIAATDANPSNSKADGFSRLQSMFADSSGVDQLTNIKNTGYSTYGMSTLRWTDYGASCMSEGSLLTGISNLLLTVMVIFPSSFAMALISFAMNNVLYSVYGAMVSPVIGLFASVFKPWVVVIAVMIGLPFAWIKGKGSLSKLLSATAWVAFILSIFFYVQNNASGVFQFANNGVTNLTSFASCMMLNANNTGQANFQGVGTASGGGCATDIVSQIVHGTSPSNGVFTEASGVSQALWYGIPYQVWSMGEVGPDQASVDRATEGDTAHQISWSAAILNGQYAGPDDKRLQRAVSIWNNGNYDPTKDQDKGSKVGYWTNYKNMDDWQTADSGGTQLGSPASEIPFLGVVRALCDDTYSKDDGTNDNAFNDGDATHASANKWGYGGSCDSGGAGTTHIVTTVQGNAFEQRISAAVAGGLCALIVLFVLGFAAMYLIFQKLSFYFLMMFAPLFLAIGAFPDEKRSAFAKKFGEAILANVIKQVVAVMSVIFVAQSVSTVLGNASIPWLLKPLAILAFFFALLFFAVPLSRILRAAAKGDTSVIDKVVNAPKTALKVAAVGAAVAATAGIAAPILAGGAGGGMLASVGGARGLAQGGLKALKSHGGRMAVSTLSRRGGMGGAMARHGYSIGAGAVANAKAEVDINTHGINTMDAVDLAKRNRLTNGGLNPEGANGANLYDRDPKTGALTRIGRGQALTEWKRTQADTEAYKKSKEIKDDYYDQWSRMNNGAIHPDDTRIADKEEKFAAQKAARDEWRANNPGKSDPENAEWNSTEGQPADGRGSRSDAGSNGETSRTDRAEQAAARAMDKVGEQPGFAKSGGAWGPASTVVETSSAIEERFGGRDQLVQNVLQTEGADLVNNTYSGNAAFVDATHPAGAAVVQQIFANASGDPELSKVASSELADAIKQHGAPTIVVSPSSAGSVAAFDEAGLANLVAALPSVRPDTSLDERYRGAMAFAQVSSTIPAEHPLFGIVDSARAAVMDPTASANDVNHFSNVIGTNVNDYQASILNAARQAAATAARESVATHLPAGIAEATAAATAAATATAVAEHVGEHGRRSAFDPIPRQPKTQWAPPPTPSNGLWGNSSTPNAGAETAKIVDAVKDAMSAQKADSVDAVAEAAKSTINEALPDVDEAGTFNPGRRRDRRKPQRGSIFDSNEEN